MSKESICLVSFVLVLSLASSASSDLVAHWRLDDGSCTVATETVGIRIQTVQIKLIELNDCVFSSLLPLAHPSA